MTDSAIKGIVKYDILPTIREYWFDNEKKANEWSDRIIKALND
jgi:5-methylcytosine-specific restriction protein B